MSAVGGEQRALRLVIEGRVQGVGYRWFARKAGRELGLAGKVRNLPDGRVEVHAAGDPEQLACFIDRLREGPPAARVTGIAEEELATVPAWNGFDIDR
ncbi:MAG TPA: acylphosphatase [Thermoanaerobaculia bacterium]|nr:acylphosphatase [Thermoanaerobaculia bacterium]